MIVDYAVMSTMTTELYLDFWLPVSKLWKSVWVLLLFYYILEMEQITEYGIVIKMSAKRKPPLATCWARYWWAGQQKDKVTIISDIDIIFSKWYWLKRYDLTIQNISI